MTATARIVLFIFVLVYLVILFNLIKRKKYELKYTLIWMLLGFTMLILISFPSILEYVSYLIGVSLPINTLFILGIFFSLFISMCITAIVSSLTTKVKKIAQYVAILEKRVRELENK